MIRDPMFTRRRLIASLAAAGAASQLGSRALAQAGNAIRRPIPSSGERLPAVGLGTAIVFDVGADTAARARLRDVVRTLIDGGGRLIDTASAYGSAEEVLGDLLAPGLRAQAFVATKLRAPDAAELKRSLARLRTDRVDLLQLHNVADRAQSLAAFRDWKAQGVCRYVGITSTFHRDFDAVEAVLERERPDFLQVDYSIDNRVVEERLLPAAAQAQAAVLTALPFGRARLFRAVRGKPLPDWAKEFDARSWAQFFLKWLLGDERITAVIPGTADPAHMADNLGAMHGRLPDAALRRRMVGFVQSL